MYENKWNGMERNEDQGISVSISTFRDLTVNSLCQNITRSMGSLQHGLQPSHRLQSLSQRLVSTASSPSATHDLKPATILQPSQESG
jgi:hypothetical protein